MKSTEGLYNELVLAIRTLTDRQARLFACDCADAVKHLYDRNLDMDDAVLVARRHAEGRATDGELSAAYFTCTRHVEYAICHSDIRLNFRAWSACESDPVLAAEECARGAAQSAADASGIAHDLVYRAVIVYFTAVAVELNGVTK